MLRFSMYTLGVIFVFAGIAIGIAEYMIYGFSLAIVLGNVLLIAIGALTLVWAEKVVEEITDDGIEESFTLLCNCMACKAYRSHANG